MDKRGIATAIKQSRPFDGPEHEAFLALQRVAFELVQGVAVLLKPYGLSGVQYNVLRILRGAGSNGLSCGEVADRLVTRDPDVTRLLDRMQKQGWVERGRDEHDRRVVTTHITPDGRALVDSIDKPMAELHRQQLGHLGATKLRSLKSLLNHALQANGS